MDLYSNFIDGSWSQKIDVTDFVRKNITPYEGDASFLVGPTERTKRIWDICLKALEEERNNNGVRSFDPDTVSTITSHKPGYIDQENELIVGLQTNSSSVPSSLSAASRWLKKPAHKMARKLIQE